MLFLYLAIIALVVAVDQLTKYLIIVNLKDSSASVIPHLLSFVYTENRGVAFSLFQDGRIFFIVITLLVIGVFAYVMIKNYNKSKLLNIACALIIGGGIGNLIDRIFRGFVVDFLSLSFFSPICNVADYCITFGTVILIIYLLFFSDAMKKDKQKKLEKKEHEED